jgi:hypothetical protein
MGYSFHDTNILMARSPHLAFGEEENAHVISTPPSVQAAQFRRLTSLTASRALRGGFTCERPRVIYLRLKIPPATPLTLY